MCRKSPTAFGFVLVAMAGTADAQQETSLQRIVVTAGEEKVAIETPQAVAVIDSADLEAAQADTVGDIVSAAPGVTVVGGDRVLGESLNIRGIGAAASADEPRIIVSIDGVSKYYEQYRLGSFFIEPDLFKRVEILRGPASSTLYGAGALGGVITFETRDPADFLTPDRSWALRQKVGLTANAGGLGFLTSTIAAARPAKGVELLFNGIVRRTPEHRDGGNAVVEGTDALTFSGLAKGVFTFGQDDAHRIELSWTRFQTELNDQPYSQTGLGGGFGFFGTADRDIEDDTVLLSYNYAPPASDWIDLTLAASWSSSRSFQTDVSPGLVFAFGDAWDIAYDIVQLKAGNTATFTGAGWELFVTGGVSLAHQDRVSDATLRGMPFNVGSHPAGEQLAIGAYLQAEYVWDGWLTVIPGIRIDQVATEAGGSVPASVAIRAHDFTLVSPKLAAHARVTDWLGLFGSVSQTERAPVIDELYDVDNFATPVIGDPGKETAFSVEAGFALGFSDIALPGDALQLKTTAFSTRIDDLIWRAGDMLPYSNDAHADYHGIEIEAAYESTHLFGRVALSMIRGTLFDGSNLDSIPADELRVTLGGRLPAHDLAFGWRGTFAAAQDRVSNPASTVPGGGAPTSGYVVHDIFATWTPDTGPFAGTEFRASVENILDKRYRPHLSGDEAAGLTAKLTLSRSF